MVLLAAFVVITGHMAMYFIMFVDPWQRSRDSGYFKSWLKDTEYGFYHKLLGPTRKRRPVHRKHKRLRALRICSAIACAAACQNTSACKRYQKDQLSFDSDSTLLRIDNHASRSITNCIKDVISLQHDKRCRINGIGGDIDGTKCTLSWKIEDDDGEIKTIVLPDSIYAPKSPSKILSPQHWAQVAKDNKPEPKGTWCATYDDAIILYWDQRKFKRTVPLDPGSTNTGCIYTAPGYRAFQAFLEEANLKEDEMICYNANLFSDAENEVDDENFDDDKFDEDSQDEESNAQRDNPLQTTFDLNGPSTQQEGEPVHIVEDEETTKYHDVSAEFLKWHHHLGHVSPKKI